MVVLWGECYRRYFTDWCLPSLLAPGNLPALTGDVKCLIVCPDEDWRAIKTTPAFDRLTRCAQPVHVPFEPDRNLNPCKAMGAGHRMATQHIAEAKGVGIPVTPDLMLSDRLLANAQRMAESGASVVLTCALRFAEEALIVAMHRRWKHIGQLPLIISAREMAAMGLESMHAETRSYEWGRPGLHPSPSALWVPVAGGMVCCTMSWAPVWLDYSTVAAHTTQTFDRWTMDGDYVYRNWGDGPTVRAMRDTDDGCLVSWSPETRDDGKPIPPPTHLESDALGRWFNHRQFDPLKRKLFWEPVLWHGGELHAGYLTAEQRLLDDLGSRLRYDWRRGGFVNDAGQIVGTLAETTDDYETRARQRT